MCERSLYFSVFADSLDFLEFGEDRVFLERELDGTSDAIYIPVGFPYGGDAETVAYVSDN